MARTLADLQVPPSDDDAVRQWLADRGLVTAERCLLESLAACDEPAGGRLKAVYDGSTDRYLGRK